MFLWSPLRRTAFAFFNDCPAIGKTEKYDISKDKVLYTIG